MNLKCLVSIILVLLTLSAKAESGREYVPESDLMFRLEQEVLSNQNVDQKGSECSSLTDICGNLENCFVQLLGIVNNSDVRLFNPWDGNGSILESIVYCWTRACPEVFNQDYIFKYLGDCSFETRIFVYRQMDMNAVTELRLHPIFDDLINDKATRFSAKLEFVYMFFMSDFAVYLALKHDDPKYKKLPSLIQEGNNLMRSEDASLAERDKLVKEFLDIDLKWTDIYVLLFSISQNTNLHLKKDEEKVIETRHPELYSDLQEKWCYVNAY